jgi:hypothetical protein
MNDCGESYENELIGEIIDEKAKWGKEKRLISTKVDLDD